MTEAYVCFETAKLLKEKGFDEYCPLWYNLDKPIEGPFFYKEIGWYGHNSYDYNEKRIVSAPTLQMTMKWLREVHGLHISLEPCYDYDSMHVIYLAFVQNVADVHEFMDGRKNVASYPNAEKSYELAIKYCLENLIK